MCFELSNGNHKCNIKRLLDKNIYSKHSLQIDIYSKIYLFRLDSPNQLLMYLLHHYAILRFDLQTLTRLGTLGYLTLAYGGRHSMYPFLYHTCCI